MSFDVELHLHSDPDQPLPEAYYDSQVGNFPDLIEQPLLEIMGQRFTNLDGLSGLEVRKQFAAALDQLEKHPQHETLAFEQAARAVRMILEHSQRLPRATLHVTRVNMSALGRFKVGGLTIDDLEYADDPEDDN